MAGWRRKGGGESAQVGSSQGVGSQFEIASKNTNARTPGPPLAKKRVDGNMQVPSNAVKRRVPY
jgi:hypothetical protein